jgi:hypothetical protein
MSDGPSRTGRAPDEEELEEFDEPVGDIEPTVPKSQSRYLGERAQQLVVLLFDRLIALARTVS